jgi:hypothetical protein
LKLLERDAALRAALGQNGKRYVDTHYRWHTILTKYERLFARVRNQPTEPRDAARDRSRPPGRDRARPPERPRGGDHRTRGAGDRHRDRDRRRHRN